MKEIHNQTEIKKPESPRVDAFKEIRSKSEMTLNEARSFINDLAKEKYYTSYKERIDRTPENHGHWEGERGESMFVPSTDTAEAKAAKEKLAETGQRGIEYKNGEPDFSKYSEITVKIEHMTENRPQNFEAADERCADIWKQQNKEGRSDWDKDEVYNWRCDNHYSWHERCDTKTMDLVPMEIHGFFKHSGGVAECKIRDAEKSFGGAFDE